MTSLGPLLESFFLDHLYRHLEASPNTVASYRDTFCLLLRFAQGRLGRAPSELMLTDIDPPFVSAFLSHLETDRHCQPQTRNVRLSAIRSFFSYIALREPAHSGLIQRVLALPKKKSDKNLVDYMTRPEMEALINAADTTTWIGRRDRALMIVGTQTGLRVSELIALCPEHLVLGKGAHLRIRGKGRKQRCVPLTHKTAAALAAWLKEHRPEPSKPIFQTRRGAMSRDAVERIMKRHAVRATKACPALKDKRVSPHVMRHTAAMRMLEDRIGTATMALVLGHESEQTTHVYLHADLSLMEKALARTAPPSLKGNPRYRPGDRVMEFLNGL